MIFSAPLIVLLLFGLAIRLMMTRMESRFLRWTWDWLCCPDSKEINAHRSIVLNRTFQTLSAIRLARLVSLGLLVPPAVLLLEINAGNSTIESLAGLIIVIIGLFFLFVLATAFQMSRFYSEKRRSEKDFAPKWLSEESERIPGPIAAGGVLWEWIVRQAERLTPGKRVIRPQARLYESDGSLIMAVGESELEALEAQQPATMSPDEKNEHDMIRAIRRLESTLVREVMRPLNKIAAVPLTNLTTEKFLKIANRTGYTRFPCYNDQITNLIGYLNVHDFLAKPMPPKEVRRLVHSALFVPEIARVDLALQEMLRARSQIAICYDEFGGCSGLLSREDIIEEITGDITDEYDRPESAKIQRAHGHYLVDAAIDLDDLREQVGLSLEKRHADTLAGYIYSHFNRTPRRGEGFEVQGWRIDVFQMDKHLVRRVRINPPGMPEEVQ